MLNEVDIEPIYMQRSDPMMEVIAVICPCFRFLHTDGPGVWSSHLALFPDRLGAVHQEGDGVHIQREATEAQVPLLITE